MELFDNLDEKPSMDKGGRKNLDKSSTDAEMMEEYYREMDAREEEKKWMADSYIERGEDKEGVPYFVYYDESSKYNVINGLRRLSGMEYVDPWAIIGQRETEYASPPPQSSFSESGTALRFIHQIIKNGAKKDAIAYLDSKINGITEKIKENYYAEGRLTPFRDEDGSDFWANPQKKEFQAAETEIRFRMWLKDLMDRLLGEPEHSRPAPPPNSNKFLNEKKNSTNDTSFRDKDKRLKYKCSNDKTKEYFLQLTQKDKDGNQYYSESQINMFLQANFAQFGSPIKVVPLPKTPRLKQIQITRFIYEFYIKYGSEENKAMDFAELLKTNFKEYFRETYTAKTIASNFSKSKNCRGYKFDPL